MTCLKRETNNERNYIETIFKLKKELKTIKHPKRVFEK